MKGMLYTYMIVQLIGTKCVQIYVKQFGQSRTHKVVTILLI